MQHTTRILGKQFSPIVACKLNDGSYTVCVGLITDVCITEKELEELWELTKEHVTGDSEIQLLRNLAGQYSTYLVEKINDKKMGSCEGVGVTIAKNGIMTSSLYGDMMNHGMCRDEFYYLVNMLCETKSKAKEIESCIIRKYNILRGWPLWIATHDYVIDDNIVVDFFKEVNDDSTLDDIRKLVKKFAYKEHCLAVAYVDKAWIFVSNQNVKLERILFNLLNVSPHV